MVGLPKGCTELEGFARAGSGEKQRLVRRVIHRRNPGGQEGEGSVSRVRRILELSKQVLPASERAWLGVAPIKEM